MIKLLLSVLVLPALAGELLPAPPSIRSLHDAILESLNKTEKAKALAELSRTPPKSLRDLPLLYDVFMRVPTQAARSAVLDSVEGIGRNNTHLEPGFLEFLKLPDPEAVLFGIKGVITLRSQRAVPELRRIVKGRFKARSVDNLSLAGERNEWWLRYEALNALAVIEGPKAFELVKSKVDETPAVARILASQYWKETLPLALRWTRGESSAEKGHEALRANVPAAALRQTRAAMLAAVKSPKTDREARHQLALKVGVSSGPEEIEELLKDYAAASHPETRLMLMTALFASRDPKIIPLLKETARTHDDPRTRLGCLVQLKDALTPGEFRPLAEAMAKDDSDPENREQAAAMLAGPA